MAKVLGAVAVVALLCSSMSLSAAQTKSTTRKSGTTQAKKTTKKTAGGSKATTARKTTSSKSQSKATSTTKPVGKTDPAKPEKDPNGATTTGAPFEPAVQYGALPVTRLTTGDLKGWKLRNPGGKNAWVAEGTSLSNTEPGTDLVSEAKFADCELHVEFNVPKGGNSGVYLQGRYEIQVADSAGATDLTTGMMGAVYSKIAPLKNAARAAGEWQTLDIHFMQAVRDKSGKIQQKAVVTVLLNDELIIDRGEIDGVTGGALDSEEGVPGPLMLQGDHTAVQYRNIIIRPLPPRVAREEEIDEQETPPPTDTAKDK